MIDCDQEYINQKIPFAANLKAFYCDVRNYYMQKNENIKYTVVHQNIRSLFANFDNFLSTVGNDISIIDILVFSEINIKETDSNKFKIEGFKKICKPRPEGRGGGLLIFYRSHFKIKVINQKFTEAEILNIIINDELNIISLYRPPSSNKRIFINELSACLDKISTEKRDIIIIGDVNINLMGENNTITEEYENTLAEQGFERCIFSPTREEFAALRFSSTLIDHVYHKFSKCQNLSSVIRYKITDHYAICCTLYNQTAPKLDKFYDKINYEEVNKMLNRYDWACIDETPPPSDNFAVAASVIQEIKNANLERKYLRHSDRTKKREKKEWITQEIEFLTVQRDKLFLKCKRNKTNKIYRENYNALRNLVNVKIKYARNTHCKRLLNECSGNSANTWRTLKEILGRSSTSIDDNILHYMPASLSTDDILQKFGEQFSLNVKNLRHACSFTAAIPHAQPYIAKQSIYIPPADLGIVEYIVKKLKLKKGPGFDKVGVRDVKNAGENFHIFLKNQMNTCLKLGDFAASLKIAITRPLYKGGAHKDFNNYRSIAILSVQAKIFESYLDIHLTNYLKEFKILDCRQFAYQKGKSVNLLLADLSSYINENLSNKEHTIGVFIDYSKAFDVLDHEILIQKLENIGIQGRFLALFKSYLANRKFIVKLANEFSDLFDLESGVPQGSILGPKLFIIYINELFKYLKIVKILIFADDILILYKHKVFSICQKYVQEDLDVLNNWSHNNKLIINVKKTVCMHFCLKTMRADLRPALILHTTECMHKLNVDCACENLTVVSTLKYLGVTLDDEFNWMPQIKNVCNKMRSIIKEIKLTKSKLTPTALRIVYFSLAHSHLIYGLPAWGTANLTPLKTLQEKLLITMSSKAQLKKEPNVHKLWNVLKLDDLYELTVLTLKYFDPNHGAKREHSHFTRTAVTNPLIMPLSQNKYHERTWDYIMPRLWNKLPPELKNLNSVNSVKEKLKDLYHSQLNS
jgi:exonuclease III